MHEQRTEEATEKRLVLVGNPNVGKSVIFGFLTGRYATVSNYPGTTVEISRGTATLRGTRTGVIDSPGVNSLVPTSDDERVTRDILLKQKADSVLQVLDAKNLRRGLLVTVQLLEMDLPLTLALNMYDEAGERGIRIELGELSKALGLNVIPTIATQRWNLEKLQDVYSLQKRALPFVAYPEAIEGGISEISKLLPASSIMISPRSVAIMLLSGDSTLGAWLEERVGEEAVKKIEEVRARVEALYAEPLGYAINRSRLKAVDMMLKKALFQEPARGGKTASLIGAVSMHPVWGIPILLAVLVLMYEFVGVLGAGVSVDFFEEVIFGRYLNPWATRVIEYAFPAGFLRDILVGPYGVITMALTYAVAIVLPIVGFFFIFFSILEDSGYLPRLALMVDRVFKFMGLNGKAVLPMVLGLGCDTMATMTTRILETRKERVIVTLLLALGVPCSAQLGVILGMLGAVSFSATVTWAGIVLFVIFIVGYFASRVVPGESSDFIIEVPPMRLPQVSNLLLKTFVRVEWYLKEAVPLFILGTLVLFALDRTGAILVVERAASPVVVGFLGLPIESTQAFIVGFLRRDYGAAGLFALQKDGLLNPVQVVVSLVTITLFVPCIANFFMIMKERGAMTAVWMTLFIFPFAFFVGGVLNLALRAIGVTF